MRVEGTFLKSRIARRTFLYFCAAALAPSMLLSALAYQVAQDSFRIAAEREVVETSKSFALRVFERLDTAALVLEGAADRAQGAVQGGDETALSALFLHVLPVDEAPPALAAALRAAMDAAGDPASPAATGQRRFRSRLVVLPAAAPESDPPRLFLVHETQGQGRSWIAGQLRPRYVWGESDELEAGHPTCVYSDQNQRLFCSKQSADDATAHRSTTLTGAWNLFLKARFGAPSWTFRTFVPRPSVRAELPELAYTIVWVWLGTVLLVALLSLRIIRRTMEPLEALIAQTRSIPKGGYLPRQRGHDEFGQLATAFDEMGVLVSQQMGTLNALSELDRKILKRQDLREVIDLVLERIQHLIPDAVVAVIAHRSAAAEWRYLHVRPVGDRVTRRSRIPVPPGTDTTASHDDPSRWTALSPEQPLAEPFATLLRLGARHGASFRLAIGDRDGGSLSLGLAGDARPSESCLQEVNELGSRITMAIAAKEREDLLVHQARHDVLTGLPNRFAAQEMLAAAIERASPLQQPFAVLFFDLDGFKAINDGLGHVSGDRVLVGAARRLARSVGAADFVARLGGDEFLVVLDDGASDEAVKRVAASALAALAAPVLLDGVELLIGASVGIAIYPQHGQDVEALIHNADIAMYQAKSSGGECCVFFEERMNVGAADCVQLESDLRQAIQAGALEVHFQPVVDCRTGAIVAAEALARWQHPIRGAVSPATFIPVAESSGLIEELGAFVLQTACREFAAWKRAGHAPATIAVNVSSRQLRSESFVGIVQSMLAQHGLHAGELEIEITESVLVADMALAATRLEAVRECGVSIAIDDFGTGYSSLAYLKSLPVDTLKIDREFVVDMAESDRALALVHAIVAMGHATGKTVVAEGVESADQVKLLRAMGCFKIQGFHFHRPMTAQALGRLLATHHRAGSTLTG